MKFEEIQPELRARKQVVNNDWNGVQNAGTIMYITLQNPDKDSMNTEPYFVMHLGNFVDIGDDKKGWVFRLFPWLPSVLDLFSEKWSVRTPTG